MGARPDAVGADAVGVHPLRHHPLGRPASGGARPAGSRACPRPPRPPRSRRRGGARPRGRPWSPRASCPMRSSAVGSWRAARATARRASGQPGEAADEAEEAEDDDEGADAARDLERWSLSTPAVTASPNRIPRKAARTSGLANQSSRRSQYIPMTAPSRAGCRGCASRGRHPARGGARGARRSALPAGGTVRERRTAGGTLGPDQVESGNLQAEGRGRCRRRRMHFARRPAGRAARRDRRAALPSVVIRTPPRCEPRCPILPNPSLDLPRHAGRRSRLPRRDRRRASSRSTPRGELPPLRRSHLPAAALDARRAARSSTRCRWAPRPGLGALLESPDVEKVFHDADYDLRLLHQDYGWRMRRIFDTRIAAQLLGLRAFGLAALLEALLRREARQEAPARRLVDAPLTRDMLDYAAQDMCFLRAARPAARRARARRAAGVGRGGVRAAGGHAVGRTRTRTPFLRSRARATSRAASWPCPARARAVARAVARELDRATFRVVGNEQLLEIARAQPPTREALAAIKGVPARHPGAARRRAAGGGAARRRGARRRPAALPARAALGARPGLRRPRVRAEAVRDAQAQRLDLDPGVLCSRDRLEAVARKDPATRRGLSPIHGAAPLAGRGARRRLREGAAGFSGEVKARQGERRRVRARSRVALPRSRGYALYGHDRPTQVQSHVRPHPRLDPVGRPEGRPHQD